MITFNNSLGFNENVEQASQRCFTFGWNKAIGMKPERLAKKEERKARVAALFSVLITMTPGEKMDLAL